MTGLVRKATLFAVCGLLAASAAFASVPSPGLSSCPPCIYLVGDDGAGTADPDGNFCVNVRDLANVPINNSLVVVDFSACSGMSICDNNEGGATVDCGTQTVRAFTGPGGDVCFTIKGHSNNGGDALPTAGFNCAKIYADGVLLCSPSVGTFDQNGSGVSGADLSAWVGDFFGVNGPHARSDYDCSGDVGGADLSAWISIFFDTNANGGSSNNCPVVPKGDCPQIP